MLNINQIATNLVTILVFFILLFGFTKLAGPIPFDVTSVTTSKSDAFTVTGEGRVDATPDSAVVRLGVVSRASTEQAAKDTLNTNVNKVIEAVKALGVPDENIKTENFNIYPEYGDLIPPSGGTMPENRNRISGYSGNTNLSIKVPAPDMVSQIVDAGVAAGANQVGGVDFEVKDKTGALNKAREIAVADAKKKAEDAARIAGFKLGKVINYTENTGGGYPMPMMAKAEDARGSSAPTQIQPGTNEIMVTVTLSYEID